jgi:hypothetical protein
MIATATEIVVSRRTPVTTTEEEEALGFLEALISDGLQKNETLYRAAASEITSYLCNQIRVGWNLCDAKAYLAGEGKFIKWVEKNFTLSHARATQLMRLSRHFQRDLTDAQTRERLNIHPVGLDASIGPHLVNQVSQTGARNLSEIFRITGILPPLALPNPNGNGAHSSATRFKQCEGALAAAEKKVDLVNAERLTTAQRESMLQHLRPFARLYASLGGDL